MTKKLVLKVEVYDEKAKTKAMKSVSSISGIESLSMDMKEKKLTVIGDVDPVKVVGKLKKSWHTELLTFGPPKEPEKKKDDEKKNDDKKEDGKKDGDKKKESEQIEELLKIYKNQFPHYTQYYHVYSAEENPNSCAIC